MDQPIQRPDAPAVTRPVPRPPAAVRRPDPGSPRFARFAGWLALVLILGVATLQQVEGWLAGVPAPAQSGSPEIAPPSLEMELTGRIAVKLSAIPSMAAGGSDQFLPSLDNIADLPEDKVRVAIVAAELGKPDDAVARLDAVRKDLNADSPLVEDVNALTALYQPAPEGGAALDQATIDRLVKNHEWFGRLAAVYGKPDSDPARAAIVGGGTALILVLFALGGGVGLAFLTGFVLMIVAIVMAASGRLRWRFVPPAPGGSIAIETVAVFAGAFILLKLVAGAVAAMTSQKTGLVFVLTSQWLLTLVILWPIVRGVRARDGFGLLGLHSGRGVLTEIGCGIVGYLACLPLLLLGILLTVTLVLIKELIEQSFGVKPPAPTNPIAEMLSEPPWVIVMLFLLATVWAPLVEETIFRGALYRYLRGWWLPVGAAAVSAVAFGLMHPYVLLAQFPVIALGAGFAVMREWRGSIIASITGHCIHNAAALSILLVVTRVLGIGAP
jgi:membrane protease YdiL (CAAX protease family)